MEEVRSKLVIIGNGFDLAHGFKTSYNDFMLWYLSGIIEIFYREERYEDKLVSVKANGKFDFVDTIPKNLSKITEFEPYFKKFQIIPEISSFLQKLIDSHKKYNWVDIENEYYHSVTRYYDNVKQDYLSKMDWVQSLRGLNEQFEYLRDKLEEYLTEVIQREIDAFTIDSNGKINKIIHNIFDRIDEGNKSLYVGYDSAESNSEPVKSKITFLNFNYTNTIEKFISSYINYELIYIHGKLKDKNNPIIFGFGDETDEYYEKIENLKINDFLNNFKSFWYFKTDNYKRLLKLIDEQPYDIEILGHSCGLSDRVLLSTIFQHENCQSIKIHYYAKSETENDFFSKTQEISRHFRDKAKMRRLIVNFRDCDSIN